MNTTTDNKTWDEMRKEFAAMLGWEEPLPPHVFQKAMADEKYAQYLLSARNNPRYLRILFGLPPDTQPPAQPPPRQQPLSNRQLITNAATALLRWSTTGFSLVDQPTYATRTGACTGCSHLQQHPDTLLYKFRLSRQDTRICGICGCVASLKARLSSESCPMEDPENPGFTFWKEAIKPDDEAF
jgi:hypothetical protein